MGNGEHMLPYDGVEQGTVRVNPNLSYGRELVDTYTRLLSINKYVFMSPRTLALIVALIKTQNATVLRTRAS